MPELPEVETVRRGLEGSVAGATIKKATLRRENLRAAFSPGFATSLTGRKITAISRRAKYLLFFLDGDMVLIAHLGMTGRFSVVPEIPEEKGGAQFAAHDHVVFTLDDGRLIIYNDARRFGVMDICTRAELQNHKLLAHLAPEPLGGEFTSEYLHKALGKRATPVKPALMDQKIVVGVGNIYANEALFMSGISPLRAANSINDKIPLLISNIHEVLNNAIAAGGSTLRDFTHVSGESGYFQHNFHVYGRAGKPCPKCKTPITSVRQAGRASFYCENCQK